ncbi:hypothetical protein FB106_10459 [Synechococcus sp. Ace-Pa]|nr:hypothetical protein BM449_12285 [Synechococcus sp. SynAce01]TWB93278.1 hypothetical protein FB106_10459 [Synechococcus sp. Ace-Pa]
MQPFFNLPDHQSAKEGALRKHLDSKMVMRWLPLYELCLYSGSCNRAAGSSCYSQATLNRAHRSVVQLLEEAESKQLANLLATLRTTAQQLRTAEDGCRLEVDDFIPSLLVGHGLQVESWVRKTADLSASLVLIGDGICDAFVGSLYELGMEDNKKLLEFQGKRYVAQALTRVPLWGVGPVDVPFNEAAETKILSLEGGLSHPRLLRHLESLGYRIQTTSARRKERQYQPMAHLVHHLRLPLQPLSGQFCVIEPKPIDHDVIGLVYSASYAEEQPYFHSLMEQLANQLRQTLAEQSRAADMIMKLNGG